MIDTKKYLYDGRIYLSELVQGMVGFEKSDLIGVVCCEDFDGKVGHYAIGLVEVKPWDYYYQKNRWLLTKIDNRISDSDSSKVMEYLKTELASDCTAMVVNHRKSLEGVI
jgi:hypothetical protein